MKNCKSGFGLLEVIVAAVVLGFLIVGLNTLQKGNREAVLRIRTRDVAQLVATDIIDSLRRTGLYSIDENTLRLTLNEPLVLEKTFEGAVGKSKVEYRVAVDINSDGISDDDMIHTTGEDTELSRAARENAATANQNQLAYNYAKRIDVRVEWDFKKSVQSIQVSEVIR